MLLTIIIFILILSILIFSHEFGHFISAKKAGMKVEEFGFGFPPRIFSVKKGETVYSLNLIPIGGFVKILGEQRPKNKESMGNKRAFYAKPIWQRVIVIAMGVVMNLLLAVVLLSIVHGLGIPTVIERDSPPAKNIQIQIVSIAPNSPAQNIGLKLGDSITELKVKFPPTADQPQAEKVNEVEDVQKFIARYAGEEVSLTILRGKETLEKSLVPRLSPPENEGPIGIALAKVGIVSYPWYKAIWLGFKTTGKLTAGFIALFYQLIKTLILKGVLIGEIAGPIGIASLTAQFTKLGLVYILQFVAFISINLAIINAIPFPALDGGRILFLLIEKIKGSPVNAKVENLVNNIGFALLIVLMILVTFRDITKLF